MIRIAIRAASQPTITPPASRTGNRASADCTEGSGTPAMTKSMNRAASAMAAASFSRLSPSMILARRRGAEIDRKMPTTADGSVVETIAPTSSAAERLSELANASE